MKSKRPEPARGAVVAAALRCLGVRGILFTASKLGYITELSCAMPTCLCPEELGGRKYFAPVTRVLPDWMPTADHIHLKAEGGQRTVDNVRLAHRLCNRIDYSRRIGRSDVRDLARVEAARAKALEDRLAQSRTWSVLVWNMGLGSPPRRNWRRNWRRLTEVMNEYSVDIALLSEVSTTVLTGVEGVLYAPDGTRGLDSKPRDWCVAILSRHSVEPICNAQAVSYRGRRPHVPFKNSRPGSWIAGLVPVPGVGKVTCVSVYGLMDELSEASVHRSLSEISPLFSDPRYKELVLMGGDLNSSTQWPKGPHLDLDRAILARIKAYGLVDCLEEKRQPGRLENCTCTLDNCTHTWTRFDPHHPALQVDYFFASDQLAKNRLQSCSALDPGDWSEFSDHAPIIATFQ